MQDLNYYNTLIAVADDCRVDRGIVPLPKAGRKTVAVLQYEMIASAPYGHTQEDVLFESWFAREYATAEFSDSERSQARREFFGRPQACLRASPLPKTYGWGLLFDADGRIALCAMQSPKYQRLVAGQDDTITVLKALRSRR
jgi:hypothetical protein